MTHDDRERGPAPFTSVADILSFAIREEEKAATFYKRMAGRATSKRMKEIFESFAREEAFHKAKLQSFGVEGPGHLPEAILREMAVDTYAVADEADPEMEYAEALRLAIRKETAAARLYRDLADNAPSDATRRALNGMAEEELAHKRAFEEEYVEIVGAPE